MKGDLLEVRNISGGNFTFENELAAAAYLVVFTSYKGERQVEKIIVD